jgi:hypothetical protein
MYQSLATLCQVVPETRHIENSRLRQIFRIRWPDTMSNEELHRGYQATIASEIIRQT